MEGTKEGEREREIEKETKSKRRNSLMISFYVHIEKIL